MAESVRRGNEVGTELKTTRFADDVVAVRNGDNSRQSPSDDRFEILSYRYCIPVSTCSDPTRIGPLEDQESASGRCHEATQ